MPAHTDQQLLKALIHDASVLCDGAGEREVLRIKRELAIAEAIVSGRATTADREAVVDLVHPATRSHYLA